MHQATDLLSQYALYHRDQRNITTHFFGVPLIILGAGLLLTQPSWQLAGVGWTAAWVLFALAGLWYVVRGGVILGGLTSLVVGALVCLAHQMARGNATDDVLTWGGMAFAVGWVIQMIGHWYEGKRPAFIDDISGLLVAPMFMVAEVLFSRGWNAPLSQEIERRAGPTMLRDMAI